MENDFSDIIRKYCYIEGESFIIKGKSKEKNDIQLNFNEYMNNEFFNISLLSVNYMDNIDIPKNFVVEWSDSCFLILQKECNRIINLTTSETITAEQLRDKRVYYISKELKNLDDVGVYNSIRKMTPKSGYLSVGLIFFALMTPLYSNLFNTRLVYSDTYHSVFFITGIFVMFVILELTLKSIVYDKAAYQVKNNNIRCNAFYLQALKLSNCRNAAVKVRTIDTSASSLWESYPLIMVDMALAFLFIICLFVMMGGYAFPLVVYYVLLVFICIYIRFSAYRKTLQTNAANYEKMSVLISLEEKRKEIKFLKNIFFEKLLLDKTNKDECTKMEMNIENHHWAEMIKANSFISMIVMFTSAYFAISDGIITTASIIAIMIINSRLSGALVSGINRIYMTKLHSFHILSSLKELMKDQDHHLSHSGIMISKIEDFSVNKLSINFNGRKLVENLSLTAVPGDFIGIIGPSGCGKTTLIRALSNLTQNYTGDIKLNGVHISHIAENYIQGKMAYHSANSNFIKGTIRENFTSYGVISEDDMIKILKLCCKNLILSKENIDDKYVDELNLSNGERQRVLLCLSLYKKPEIIFLDESTSFLSSSDAISFLEEIKEFYSGSIVFFATHDVALSKLFTRTINLVSNRANNTNSVSIPFMKI